MHVTNQISLKVHKNFGWVTERERFIEARNVVCIQWVEKNSSTWLSPVPLHYFHPLCIGEMTKNVILTNSFFFSGYRSHKAQKGRENAKSSSSWSWGVRWSSLPGDWKPTTKYPVRLTSQYFPMVILSALSTRQNIYSNMKTLIFSPYKLFLTLSATLDMILISMHTLSVASWHKIIPFLLLPLKPFYYLCYAALLLTRFFVPLLNAPSNFQGKQIREYNQVVWAMI